MEFQLQPSKEEELNLNLIAHCREFDEYYEYCFFDDYEEKYEKFHVHSIQLGHVFAAILETKGRHVLMSAVASHLSDVKPCCVVESVSSMLNEQ